MVISNAYCSYMTYKLHLFRPIKTNIVSLLPTETYIGGTNLNSYDTYVGSIGLYRYQHFS